MAFVDVMSAIISPKSFPQFVRGLVEGSPRVIAGISWALTSSRNFPPHLLLEALNYAGHLEVGHPRGDLGPEEPLRRARAAAMPPTARRPTRRPPCFASSATIADPQALPELIGRMGGKDPIARVHIINILARFNTREVQTALQQQLKDPNKLIRAATLSALQRMDGPIDVERVCALLKDPEIDVQNKAIDVVIKANHPDTIKYLIEILKDENENARRAAVEVLNEIGNAEHRQAPARRAQGQRLVGAQPRRRRAGQDRRSEGDRGRAAADPRQGRGHPPLRHRDPQPDEGRARRRQPDQCHPRHRLVGERARRRCAGRDRQQDAPCRGSWRCSRRGNIKAIPVVVRALGRIGDAKVVDALLPLVARPEREIRIEAIQAVGKLADERRAEQVRATAPGLRQQSRRTRRSRAWRTRRSRRSTNRSRAGIGSGSCRIGLAGPDAHGRNAAVHPAAAGFRTGGRQDHVHVRGADRSTPPSRRRSASKLDISTLKAGDIIEGRYKYIDRIGRGAFGTVLLMEDTVVDERLILKFLNPNVSEDEEVMKRFVHELRYSRKITHKNVIRIYDFLYIQGNYAISMEYFPSHTLGSEIVNEKPMDLKRAIGFGIDMCTGMTVAHQVGIVHRDLKPANVLINKEGLLKIVDFGVAAAQREGDTQLTKTGYVIGSPKYMAPEQILGKKVDERADIYAVGVILYEMLTGVPPYTRGDHMSVMYQHVQGKARPPREVNPHLPDGLERSGHARPCRSTRPSASRRWKRCASRWLATCNGRPQGAKNAGVLILRPAPRAEGSG